MPLRAISDALSFSPWSSTTATLLVQKRGDRTHELVLGQTQR